MGDEAIEAEIDKLEREREALRRDEAVGPEQEHRHHDRLEAIQVELDRLWDLRRQRQALRDADAPTDWAQKRDAETVESYEQ